MKPLIIKISPELEVLLPLLKPEYSVVTTLNMKDKFIIKHDIKTMAEKNRIEYLYNNCIFISNSLFNEVWDEDKIKIEILQFARTKFKCRKRTFPESLDPVEDFYKFILTPPDSSEDGKILELFNSFGSSTFIPIYLRMCDESSVPQVNASLYTFISKILADTGSMFYKKKKMVLGAKICKNFPSALDAYNMRVRDPYGLTHLKFFMDLWK